MKKKIKIGPFVFNRGDIKYYGSVCIGFMLVMWIAGYTMLWTGNDYALGVEYLKSNPKLIAEVGNVTNTRPGFINYKHRVAGSTGESQYFVIVYGERKTGVVHMELKAVDGMWRVKDAYLESENGPINLMAPAAQ